MTQHDVTSQHQQGRHMKEDDSCWCNGPTCDPSTTCPEKDGTHLPSKNYWLWTNSVFLENFTSPSHPLTFWSNTTSMKIKIKTTFEIHFIYPIWGIGWGSKNMIKYYVKKRPLYQHWTGLFILESLIMMVPTRNGTFLNQNLPKKRPAVFFF